MSHNEIINAWKSEPEDRMTNMPANPAGEELTDAELALIDGGDQFAFSGIACAQSQTQVVAAFNAAGFQNVVVL